MNAPSRTGADTGEPPEDRGLFIYGVVPSDTEPPEGLRGLDDAPVTLLPRGRVAAAVTDVALTRPPGRRADLTAYTRVVEGLAAAGPVAPVQFGSVALSAESIEDDLLGPEDDLAELLASLEGRVQYNLKVSYVEDVVIAEIVRTDPTVRALRERTRGVPDDVARADKLRLGELVSRAMEDMGGADAEMVLDTVLPLVEAHAERTRSGPEHPLDVALLVDEERRTELEESLEGLAEAVHERMRLRLIGPLPPYDFTGGASWAS